MIIAFYGTKPWEEEYLRNKLSASNPEAELFFTTEIVGQNSLPSRSDIEVLSVFVDSQVTREVIESLPNLKCIVTRSTGYDHIDLDVCREKNISVSSVPSYGEHTVAEFAFALILALSRKIFLAVDTIKETGKYSYDGLQGFDLKGKTLGVIGTGRIGRHTIKMAKGFDMNVVAYDAFPNEALTSELGFAYASFEDVLKQSDIVTIHVPAMKETEHMFNENTFPMMKRGAFLINTSRGAVVETKALVGALQSGQLGGAGLDVLEEEGVLKDEMGAYLRGTLDGHNMATVLANHILVDMPNVLITPHAAFDTIEALQRILDTSAEDISAFIKGNPINVVK